MTSIGQKIWTFSPDLMDVHVCAEDSEHKK